MTWYGGGYSSVKTYEFTAFSESSLLRDGDSNLNCGDTFTMPCSADVCISVKDDDRYLSGDSSCWGNDNATDSSYQKASINDPDGGEVGNGGQIYAEQYFWVSDQHGNWYVLIEIEQEGSGDDYFAFYTNDCYGVPPAGAELTVRGSCDVKGDWLSYSSLDSGVPCDPAPATGSISGTVFCDSDCDGVQDFATVTCGENLFKNGGFEDYSVTKSYSSSCWWGWGSYEKDYDLAGWSETGDVDIVENCYGDAYVDLGKGVKIAQTIDIAEAGAYCLSFDVAPKGCYSSDNRFQLIVDGVVIGSYTVTRSQTITLDIELPAGASTIQFVSLSGSSTGVALDDVELRQKIVTEAEPVKAGVTVVLLDANGDEVLGTDGQPITTVTDADGNYYFTDIPVGDYRVKFIAPDGLAFTQQDAGSNDAIDSDADADGMTGVISVTKNHTTTDVDAGFSYCANEEPVTANDAACVCDGESVAIDVLANDVDPENGALAITAIKIGGDFVAIAEGDKLTLDSGATVSLVGGQIVYDVSGVDAFDDLLVGESLSDSFVYQVTDLVGLTSDATVDVTVKGDEYTTAMLADDLGEVGVVTGSLAFDTTIGGSLYDFEVATVENATSRLGQVLSSLDPSAIDLTFCLSIVSPIATAPAVNSFNVSLFTSASYSAALAGATPFPASVPDLGANAANVDNVNWLLNETEGLYALGYTQGDMQRAIWNLVNGGSDSILNSSALNSYFNANPEFGNFTKAKELTDLALANDGFEAGEGDIVGLILDPVGADTQPLVIGVEFDDLKELCDCNCDQFAWV